VRIFQYHVLQITHSAVKGFRHFQARRKSNITKFGNCQPAVLVLSTLFGIYETYFEFSLNSSAAISTGKIVHTNEMLTCTNHLTRSTNAHE
jgi:hypothetical protein